MHEKWQSTHGKMVECFTRMPSDNLLHWQVYLEMSSAPHVETEADRARMEQIRKESALKADGGVLHYIPKIATGEQQTTLDILTQRINDHRNAFRRLSRPSLLATVSTLGSANARHWRDYSQVSPEQVHIAVMELAQQGIVEVRQNAITLLIEPYTNPMANVFPASATLAPCSPSSRSISASTASSAARLSSQ